MKQQRKIEKRERKRSKHKAMNLVSIYVEMYDYKLLLVIYISVYFLKDSTVSEVNVIAQLKQQIEEAKTNKVNDNKYSNAIIDYWGNNRCI